MVLVVSALRAHSVQCWPGGPALEVLLSLCHASRPYCCLLTRLSALWPLQIEITLSHLHACFFEHRLQFEQQLRSVICCVVRAGLREGYAWEVSPVIWLMSWKNYVCHTLSNSFLFLLHRKGLLMGFISSPMSGLCKGMSQTSCLGRENHVKWSDNK